MAVLAKASALIVGPLCLAAIESERLWRAGRLEKTELRAFARELARIVGGGLVLVCLGCGSDWRADPGFVAWANALPYAVVRGPMLALATHLRIFSNAGEALWFQVSHNLRGHGAFVLGRTDERALWYYFPVVLSLKLSEALLCAPLGVALLAPRALGNWAFLSAVVLLLWSVTFRVQLGVRMVLPLVALFAVGIAVALVRSVHAQKKWRGNAAVVTAAILSLWSMTIAIATWPHGIAYINRFWGGAEQGYRLTSDSNYDWGQGVKDLLRWQRESGIADLGVWYFGTDPEVARPPLRLVPLHVMKIDGGEDVVAAVRGCRLAVSTTLLYGTTMNEAHRHAAEFLRSQSPVARTMTFLIYDLCGGACVEKGAAAWL
jgi:hypothetical protein